MTSKIKLKVGSVEFEWKGDETFLKNEIPGLLSSLIENFRENSNSGEIGGGDGKPLDLQRNTFTTSSIAARTSPKYATDLFVLALYKFSESDGVNVAARNKIHEEMKTVHRVYKSSMFNNLSKTIATLLGQGLINEPVHGNFALTQIGMNEINRKLGNDKHA